MTKWEKPKIYTITSEELSDEIMASACSHFIVSCVGPNCSPIFL